MEDFDYNNFFFNDNEDIKAVRIITPNKTITSFADIHDEEAIRVMKSLYEDFEVDDDFSWSSAINDKGCVVIQMLPDFEIVFIPDIINNYQFNELFSFYQDIMKVNRMKRRNDEEDVKIYTNYSLNGKFLDLGMTLMLLKNEINSNDKKI